MDSIKIKGMSCQHCVGSVKKALEELTDLSEVAVDLEGGVATFVNNGVDRDTIREAIDRIGFDPVD